jgi:hypothetical protein
MNRSIRRAAFGLMIRETSNSGISPAILTSNSVASKPLIGLTPDVPLSIAAQVDSRSRPMGVIQPMPVMTTRLPTASLQEIGLPDRRSDLVSRARRDREQYTRGY